MFPPTSTSVPAFPYGLQLNILKYVQEELEGICFEVFQKHCPDFLEEKELDCKEMIELNWACKQLSTLEIEIDRKSLCDWIPDIRHAAVHRSRITATAACRLIDEAAKLAFSLGYDQVGEKIKMIATEMDWARCEIKKNGALTVADLSKDIKEAVEGSLTCVPAATKAGTQWKNEHSRWKISDDVTNYTIDDKMGENPWTDPTYWGQDRNRNYSRPGSTKSTPRTSPGPNRRRSGNWRARIDEPASPSEIWQAKDDASTLSKPQAYVPPAKRH